MARDDRNCAKLTHGARVAQQHTVKQGPFNIGQGDIEKSVPAGSPSMSAASSSVIPCACINGMISRATKGKVTKTVARTMPGTAKMISTLCALSQGPSQPCAPNSNTNTRPEMTGDTENGRSIKLSNRFLPLKLNLAMAQAAATPNPALKGTAMAATSNESLMAASASGSTKAFRKIAKPFRKASTKTTINGKNKTTAANTIAIPMSVRLTFWLSLVTAQSFCRVG